MLTHLLNLALTEEEKVLLPKIEKYFADTGYYDTVSMFKDFDINVTASSMFFGDFDGQDLTETDVPEIALAQKLNKCWDALVANTEPISEDEFISAKREAIEIMVADGIDENAAELATITRPNSGLRPDIAHQALTQFDEIARRFEIARESKQLQKRMIEKQEVIAARERIKNGTHTNADLDLMVKVGLAVQVGDIADQFSNAGIVFLNPLKKENPYADNYEEAFLTRGE